jgi:hypothetical protein
MSLGLSFGSEIGKVFWPVRGSRSLENTTLEKNVEELYVVLTRETGLRTGERYFSLDSCFIMLGLFFSHLCTKVTAEKKNTKPDL